MSVLKAFFSTAGIRIIMLTFFFISLFCWHFQHSTLYLDTDLGWHLRAGGEIWQNKALPGPEHYNYPIAGDRWVNHEWLLDMSSFLVFDIFGYIGLAAVFSLINTLVLVLLFYYVLRFVSRKHWIQIITMLLLLFCFLAMKPHLGIKMQVVSLLFLMILLIILAIFTFERNKNILWWLIPLFFLWANSHGSFLIGLFLLFAWAALAILAAWLRGSPKFSAVFTFPNIDWSELRRYLLIAFASFAVTFCTPYGFELYDLLLEYSDTYYMTHIVEWLPAWSYPINGKQLLYMSGGTALALIMTGVVLGVVAGPAPMKNMKLNLWHVFLFVLFLAMALKSKRHFPLFVLASLPLIMTFFQALTSRLKADSVATDRNIPHRIGMALLAAIFLLLGARQMVLAHYVQNPFDGKSYCHDYPCAAVDFLKNSEYADRKLVNAYGWGGYILKTWPEKQIFIDGRQPQKTINGKSFLEEFNRFFDEDQVEEMLELYDTQVVLIRKESKPRFSWLEMTFMDMEKKAKRSKGNHFLEYLAESMAWEMVYEDDIALIFVQKQSTEQ